MQTILWLVIVACLGGIAFLCWRLVQKARERERTEAARFAAFMDAQRGKTAAPAPAAAPSPAPALAPSTSLETQKLLFDAARKAGDAGEPALAIQLYARLLARFPDSAFAAEVRAAVEAQKKKLAKA
jgi:predicted negative regulator of RcsB-dependent stress response